AARRVDMAYQTLVAVVRPMRTPLIGRTGHQVSGFMATAVAAQHYARNLVLDASTRHADLDARSTAALAEARRQLDYSVSAITAALAPAPGPDEPDGSGGSGGDGDQSAREY